MILQGSALPWKAEMSECRLRAEVCSPCLSLEGRAGLIYGELAALPWCCVTTDKFINSQLPLLPGHGAGRGDLLLGTETPTLVIPGIISWAFH